MWEFYFWALVFPQFKSISTVQFRFFKSQLFTLQRKLQFAHLLVEETFKILLDYIEFLEDMQKIFMEFLCHFMWHLILIISHECFSSQFSVSNLEIFTAWYCLKKIIERMFLKLTVPNSLVVMVPSPSLSKRENASLNSAICSSVSWSA